MKISRSSPSKQHCDVGIQAQEKTKEKDFLNLHDTSQEPEGIIQRSRRSTLGRVRNLSNQNRSSGSSKSQTKADHEPVHGMVMGVLLAINSTELEMRQRTVHR